MKLNRRSFTPSYRDLNGRHEVNALILYSETTSSHVELKEFGTQRTFMKTMIIVLSRDEQKHCDRGKSKVDVAGQRSMNPKIRTPSGEFLLLKVLFESFVVDRSPLEAKRDSLQAGGIHGRRD